MRQKGVITIIIIAAAMLFGCSTTAKLDERLVYKQRYFFRTGADYYSRIDLQALRPLVRGLVKDLPMSQRLQVQMIAERTNRIFAYRIGIRLYSFLEGSFPKGIIDNLLTHHPEWLPLGEDIDGFRHYSANLEIGLPETNIVYATTESLRAAYGAPVLPIENVLPAYVIAAMQKRPFVIYYPHGNPIFIKDNSEFTSLPDFELLLTMLPLESKLYRIDAEFTVLNPANAGGFSAQLQSVIDWYKTYYVEWAPMLDALTMNVQGKKIIFSGVYSQEDMISLSADVVRIAVTNLENNRYITDPVQGVTPHGSPK